MWRHANGSAGNAGIRHGLMQLSAEKRNSYPKLKLHEEHETNEQPDEYRNFSEPDSLPAFL